MFELGEVDQKAKKSGKKHSLPYCGSSHNTWNKLQRAVCYKVAGTHSMKLNRTFTG